MVRLKWNRVAVVHENNLYGQSGAAKLKARGEDLGVCIVVTFPIDVANGVKTDQVKQAVDSIIVNNTLGIVVFGDSTTVTTFFEFLNEKQVSDFPIVMVSEGINMDKAAFLRRTGAYYNAARGSLAVTPLYRQVNEFQEYWKSIFMNSTVFQKESTINPLLQKVYNSIASSCTSVTCAFTALSQSQVDSKFSSQPLFVQYAIITAHAFAKVVKKLHKQHCLSSQGICDLFIDNVKPGDVITELDGVMIDFKNDFTWR